LGVVDEAGEVVGVVDEGGVGGETIVGLGILLQVMVIHPLAPMQTLHLHLTMKKKKKKKVTRKIAQVMRATLFPDTVVIVVTERPPYLTITVS
jgi:hypothetical protein